MKFTSQVPLLIIIGIIAVSTQILQTYSISTSNLRRLRHLKQDPNQTPQDPSQTQSNPTPNDKLTAQAPKLTSQAAPKLISQPKSFGHSSSDSESESLVTNKDGSVTIKRNKNGVNSVIVLKGEEAKAAIKKNNEKLKKLTNQSMKMFDNISTGFDLISSGNSYSHSSKVKNHSGLRDYRSAVGKIRNMNKIGFMDLRDMLSTQNAMIGPISFWDV